MRRKELEITKPLPSGGSTNQILSFWRSDRNMGVLSTTDAEFAKQIRCWAKMKGYLVRPEETSKK